MDKKPDDLLRRPLYVYDLPAEVLDTLALKESQDAIADLPETSKTLHSEDVRSPSAENTVGSQACSLCCLSFASVQEQRSHQKSDLHHYNLKQKLRGRKPVSEAEFEKLVGDLDESLSGSDSTDSEDDDDASRKESTLTALLKKQASLAEKSSNGTAADENENSKKKERGSGKPPLLWFSSPVLPANSYFGVYRAIFTPEEANSESELPEIIKKKQLVPIPVPKPGPDGNLTPAVSKGPHIFLCMIGGGHFAAMVVSLAPRLSKHQTGPLNREATVLAHKTFHRYTTRQKQGGSQSAHDNAKGNAHSAGSSIRRYNEQALTDEVRLLLQDWKALLDTSELLFIRATGSRSRRTLFGPYEGQVLRANDPRIRGFPFSTRRATQSELMRSFIELTRLKVREINPNEPVKAQPEETPSKGPSSKTEKSVTPKLSEEEETALLHTSQLQAFIRRSKLPALLSYFKNKDLQPNFLFQPVDSQQNHHAPTCLHLAASQNSAPLVSGLLVKAGADPTIKNKEGKTAFDLAGDRATRDAFRVARDGLGEGKWDWEAAKVPPALRREEAEQRDEREKKENERKEAERRKVEEARLKSEGPKVDNNNNKGKSNGVLGGGVPKTAQQKREEEARGLTPEQRIKLDRERRARAAEERIRRLQAGGG